MTKAILAVLAATGVAVPLTAAPAVADPAVDGQFTVSSVGANNQIAAGPDGNMWLTLDGGAADVARITPAGAVTEFNSAVITNPMGITAGPDGRLWVTQAGGVARFFPADPVNAQAFPIPAVTDPRAITVGPDGNLWTASGDKVVTIPAGNPAGFTSFAATGVLGARWIANGSDGNLWVADFGGAQIVRVTTAGVGATFPVGGGPQGVAGGANGQVAYSNPGSNPHTVGRLTTAAETVPTPLSDPFGVTFGNDGAYWFAQFAGNDLGRLTTEGQYSTLPIAAATGPRQVTAGPNNTLWVTLDTAEKVARISGVTPALQTTLTKKPNKVVRKAKVKFRFTGTAGAMFQCRVDKRDWRGCTSPKAYRLSAGKHTFRVRAVLDGRVDSTAAKWRFRIKRGR